MTDPSRFFIRSVDERGPHMVCILQSALSVEAGGASQFYVSYRRKQPLVLTESYERALRTCLQIAKEKA